MVAGTDDSAAAGLGLNLALIVTGTVMLVLRTVSFGVSKTLDEVSVNVTEIS